MPSFDLTMRPWIPVRPLEGPARDVSLRTALTQAHTFREVYAGSPLETIALYRLLQALALRIFLEPEGDRHAAADVDAWWDLYDRGHFPEQSVQAYFDEWQSEKERFDLLHPERPFYRHLEPMTKKETPLAKLFAARSSGNNATLFDHTTDDSDQPFSLAEAARGIVATQATALGGGRSKPFYYSDAPLVAGALFWIRGQNLFEALLLNTPPDSRARMTPHSTPWWERDELPEPSARPEGGYLDYLTWPARRILLRTDTRDGATVAVAMKISQGDKRENSGAHDPLMALRSSKKSGLYPLKLRKDRALWRDADVLMQVFSAEGGGAPHTFEWIAGNLKKDQWWVDAFGLVNDQAKIERWQHTRLPIYPVIFKHDQHHHDLKKALKRADKQENILQRAMRECAAHLLSPDKGYGDLSNQGREEARALAASLGAEMRFWARMEEPFFAWLHDLAETDTPETALAEWTQDLYHAACQSYREATDSLDASARHVRARTAGEARLRPAEAYLEHLT